MITVNYSIEVEIKVEVVAQNQFGTLYQTSEGFHINGNRKKFIQNIIKDVHSQDPMAKACASYALFIINNYQEI